MEGDQEVAVLFQLNLNERKEEPGSVSWDNKLTPEKQDLSLTNIENKIELQHNLELQKEIEFIKKYAPNVDSEYLNYLLLSEIDNPNRLQSVMCNELQIPFALELIEDYKKNRNNNLNNGEKRTANDTDSASENKKRKTNASENYLNQLQEMFPEADHLFLITECQNLKNSEDFSRFVNTVMISGVYPKKGTAYIGNDMSLPPPRNVNSSRDDSMVLEVTENETVGNTGFGTNWRTHTDSTDTDDSLNDSSPLQDKEFLGEASISVVNIDDSIQPNDVPEARPFNQNVLGNTVDEYPALLQDISLVIDSIPSEQQGTYQPPNVAIQNLNDSDNSIAEVLEESRRLSHDQNSFQDEFPPGPSNYGNIKQESSPKRWNDYEPKSIDVHNHTSSKDDDFIYLEPEDLVEIMFDKTDEVEKWVDEQTANLIRIFPNTDPSFLREQVTKMNMCLDTMNVFVIEKLERNDMPTRAEYEKKKEIEELQNRYTKNFSIEDFLKVLPDPWKHFTSGKRNCDKYKRHSLCYLKTTFKRHYVRDIINTLNKNKNNLYVSYKALKKDETKMRGRRSDFHCNCNRPTTIDIQFLQEVAFIENEEKIRNYLNTKKIEREMKFQEAKLNGTLLECQCCFDSEVMVEDTVYCSNDHTFCKDCIIKSVEVDMGNGKCVFACPASCDAKFSLACLQTILKPELFSKVLEANQMEEIRAAGIEDLVQCPFCSYATIMPPEQKVMVCLNPECLKESCRMCKELNHIPLRCEEVEKSDEVKMRTFIENKMTEALVRTCYNCHKKFVKEDGCNKMTCTCGAKMCYICRKPVENYSHFNGQGGTEYHKCPLYSTNDELHVDLVARVGAEAKAHILQTNPQGRLLHDPTAVIPERTNDNPMPGMNNGAAIRHAFRGILYEVERQKNNNNQESDTDSDEDEQPNPRAQIRRHYHHYHTRQRYHRHH
ncbi:hypothetical protein RUM44_003877 [Polyplax serrata]|uniref:RING-type domain-containing protein n=1 Tax=Polyplax serrata TaxID=468196 RepID=A0ABR1B199_POLSC